jgi:hypothetical protein
MPVQKGHRDRRVLLVNGEEVVIFGSKLTELFSQVGIKPPNLIRGGKFDIVPFIREKVVSALNEKPRDVAMIKMARLIRIGCDLGININLSKRITLKTK